MSTTTTTTPTTAALATDRRVHALVIAMLLVVGGIGSIAFAGVASAQTNETATESLDEKAPYYADNTTQVDNESWMAGNENATLESFVTMLSRLGTFVIGEPPDDNGPGGAIIVGLIVAGTIGSTFIRAGPGPVGGAVIGLVALAGVTAVGLAPVWLMGVSLFGLGLVLTSVIIGVLR
ncbi:hypothetical protein HWV23_02685 [Natronomonas halophila]|uniref:hypothetical protein n=1 Tax=Natronomonas halophila TaxID=2747817 RepID=UPI0015B390C7|nr:hypothetical protein [Natronomonas halophila]QLD84606.1 hypothetical protein HWV23_02400 [Natronomonas halophila]QLD84662.1 hypothetical protein HWV23_02685 [Natronomonas halophila]